ncbi:hypothetical protein K435DRAFT_685083, partial [Dendrothele bispora CBS 962.96]
INKSISSFLANKRAYNDVSNRAEFLRSLAEKRASMPDPPETIPSCARADAKVVNRDAQMKYDIAKNEDGPLRRTVKLTIKPPAESGTSSASASTPTATTVAKGKGKAQNVKKDTVGKAVNLSLTDEDRLTAGRHPGLDERLTNVENHLAVRYVPSPPRNLLDRLQYLEDHIIRLEKEYPPWAALHFNQPNRGWPPPPRATPIIVPSHLTDSSKDTLSKTPSLGGSGTGGGPSLVGSGNGATPSSGTPVIPKGRKDSSLHRAVMERLEVQNAKNDLNVAGR